MAMATTDFGSATLYRRIFEQCPDAVILVDLDGSITLWNDRAAALFGHAAQDVVGKGLELIIPETLRDAHWRGFRRAIETGTTQYAGKAMTTRSVHKDGRKLYVEMSFSLLKNDEGRVFGVLAFVRDATEAFLAKRALQARIVELEAEIEAVRSSAAKGG